MKPTILRAKKLFSRWLLPGAFIVLLLAAAAIQAQAQCPTPVFNSFQSKITAYITAQTCSPAVSFNPTVLDSTGLSFAFSEIGATNRKGLGKGSGLSFNRGSTYVTITATNACGSVDLNFEVSVKDTLKPVFSAIPDITVSNARNLCGAFVNWAIPLATDPCPGDDFPDSLEVQGYLDMGQFAGSTYLQTPLRGSWAIGDAFATYAGGHLIFINSRAESDYLESVVDDTLRIWIGLKKFPGGWAWSDSSSIAPFTNWCTWQPDDSMGGQNFGLIHSRNLNNVNMAGPATCWDDAQELSAAYPRNNYYGIIEKKTSALQITRTGGLDTGAFFPVGTTVVTYQATDPSGNIGTVSFRVNVVDTQKPVFASIPDITVPNDPNACGARVRFATPTATDPCPGCDVAKATNLGFLKLGEFRGHSYFRTPYRASWIEADSLARSIGGYLTSIDSQVEQTFIASLLPDSVLGWIGLVKKNGVFVWSNGNALNYTNWCQGQPDNWLGGQDFGVIHSAGVAGPVACWDDAHPPGPLHPNNYFYGLVEVPNCALQVVRTGGLDSGAFFPIGTTVVTFQATDGSGNVGNLSFKVTVRDTLKPVFGSVSNITVNSDPNSCGAVVSYHIPTATDPCPGCGLDSVVKQGFVKLGEFGTHTYLRTPLIGSWADDDIAARSIGGYLASIDSAIENAFIANLLPDTTLAWIGLVKKNGVWTWSNHNPISYTNWCLGQPDNWLGGQDFGCIHSRGVLGARTCWDDAHAASVLHPNYFYGLVEINTCGPRIIRTSGLDSGAFFPIGTTTVTYQAVDDAGNTGTVSFTITVIDKNTPPCPATSQFSSLSNFAGIDPVIYPNPTTGILNVELPFVEKEATITITDIQGRVVNTRAVNAKSSEKIRIDLGANPRGIYLMDIMRDGTRSRFKVVLQ